MRRTGLGSKLSEKKLIQILSSGSELPVEKQKEPGFFLNGFLSLDLIRILSMKRTGSVSNLSKNGSGSASQALSSLLKGEGARGWFLCWGEQDLDPTFQKKRIGIRRSSSEPGVDYYSGSVYSDPIRWRTRSGSIPSEKTGSGSANLALSSLRRRVQGLNIDLDPCDSTLPGLIHEKTGSGSTGLALSFLLRRRRVQGLNIDLDSTLPGLIHEKNLIRIYRTGSELPVEKEKEPGVEYWWSPERSPHKSLFHYEMLK